MSSIFPLRERVSLDQREPRLVDLDEETADEVFEALSSRTTREIFLALHDSPQTTSDLAEATDTSVQNAQYHLEKLREVDLVEVVDTWYSERGSEMNVFAPTDESLVLFAGTNKQHSLRRLLDRFVGALGMLVPSSVLVGLAARWRQTTASTETATTGNVSAATGAQEDDADAATMSERHDGPDGETVEDETDLAAQDDAEETTDTETADAGNETVADDAGDGAPPEEAGELQESVDGTVEVVDAAAGIDPLLAAGLFFVGGLVLFLGLTAWYGPGGRF